MELGWIDYSEEARQKTLAVLAALQEPTAIDELGIGIVRDAFADELFPTTSTLFTKARYLFLVPYALRDMEREDNTSKTARQLRRSYDDREKQLAIRLLKANAADTTGIIGARSLRGDFSGHWVKRGPAVIYWATIRKLGLCRNPDMGFDEFFRTIEGRGASSRRRSSAEDAANGWNDDDMASQSLWHIPDASYANWHDSASIALTQEEASFLRRQLELKYPESLYSLIMQDPDVYATATGAFAQGSQEGDEDASLAAANAFPAFASKVRGMVDEGLGDMLTHAVAFSDFIYACRIRYNAQLDTTGEEAEQEWSVISPTAPLIANALDIDWIYEHLDIFSHAGSHPLYQFLLEARSCMAEGDVARLDECIRIRERSIKHERAKIGRSEGIPDNWRGGRRLSYRFEVAASFANEVWMAGDEDA
ncbi:DUF6361 family protein [Curtanaerobium respiraculi]|uniref:DUF6361 family protein n=1 Tax=Curtanaerobium respiraculi TaxID=2949669 RepID=UPI0024B3B3BB|nr:DUF6361 family protein [Curtanaerobium respiraculi]